MKLISLSLIVALLVASCSSNSEKEATPQVDAENKINPVSSSEDSIAETEYTLDSAALGDIVNLEIGMSDKEVKEIMGEPNSINNLSPNKENPAEDWFYGEKQKVRMVKGKVNRVVYDTEKEKDLIVKLLEAREDGDEDLEKKLIEKLKKNQY